MPAYAGAAFVGFSRVYADKHYVSDVVAGAALGTLSSFLFTDRFTGVDVTPVAEGGRFGVEIRMGLGSEARRGAGDFRPLPHRSLNSSEGTNR